MAKFNFAFLKNMRRNPYLSVFLIIIVLLPLMVFSVAAPVKTGTKIMCRYNHLIEDNTRTVLAWRWQASSYKITTEKSLCAKHRRLESLLRQAQEARDKKDNERAKKLLAEIKAADPTFQRGNVAALEADVNPGGSTAGPTTPGSTPGTTPGTTPGGSTPDYSGELAGLFPASLSGYTQVNDSPGQLSASRMYTANTQSHPNVGLLTIQFSRAGSAATAEEYIKHYVKAYYGADAKTLQVRGQSAYFGTDGSDLAILAYPVSGIVVELEISALDGKGANLYDTLVELSKTVP